MNRLMLPAVSRLEDVTASYDAGLQTMYEEKKQLAKTNRAIINVVNPLIPLPPFIRKWCIGLGDLLEKQLYHVQTIDTTLEGMIEFCSEDLGQLLAYEHTLQTRIAECLDKDNVLATQAKEQEERAPGKCDDYLGVLQQLEQVLAAKSAQSARAINCHRLRDTQQYAKEIRHLTPLVQDISDVFSAAHVNIRDRAEHLAATNGAKVHIVAFGKGSKLIRETLGEIHHNTIKVYAAVEEGLADINALFQSIKRGVYQPHMPLLEAKRALPLRKSI